jgi:release factor glutamine methyltransferase
MSSSPDSWTVQEAMDTARSRGLDRLDAQILLSHVLIRPRSWLLAHDDFRLDAQQVHNLRALIDRRASGEPIAYLLGEKEFHGLTLRVSPDVLIPRPDTETLVDWALELLSGELGALMQPKVIDLGTGSGAIAVALKQAYPSASMTALDMSAAALDIARQNAQRLGLDIGFEQGDWWEAVCSHRFHLAISNPPYIAGHDPHLAALKHEPQLALTPGGDGLDAFRQIIEDAPEHLEPGGWLLLEHGYDQAGAVSSMLGARFELIATRHDLSGNARCTGGRLH